MTIDMTQFIAPKSDQLNADDLIGGPRTIRITGVRANPDSAEQPVSISFDGDQGKPYKPCKSMRRVMVAIWGPDASQYVGRAMTIYRDPKVQFGGMQVGGIRISHMTDIDSDVTMALTATRASRKPYTVKPLRMQVDKVAEGVREILARIEAGEDVAADASVQKQRAWLAKNRPELAAQIDATLAVVDDPFEGPADEQRGERHTDADMITDDLIAQAEGRS